MTTAVQITLIICVTIVASLFILMTCGNDKKEGDN